MKWNELLHKKMISAAVLGAVVCIASAPYTMVSAQDAEAMLPMPPMEVQGPQPGFGPGHGKFAFSHRIQQMVRDGKITDDQATKLMDAMKKFHKRQMREHREFMDSLPDKTGISEDTLKEIFVRPQRPPMPPQDRHDHDHDGDN